MAQLYHNHAIDEAGAVEDAERLATAVTLYAEARALFDTPKYTHCGKILSGVWQRQQEAMNLAAPAAPGGGADVAAVAPAAAVPQAVGAVEVGGDDGVGVMAVHDCYEGGGGGGGGG